MGGTACVTHQGAEQTDLDLPAALPVPDLIRSDVVQSIRRL
jgi:hypothetical protein